MTKLPDFPSEGSSLEIIEAWEENFYNIFENISMQYEVCDELELIRELQKVDPLVTENDISEYTLKIEIDGNFPSPEQVNNIEKGLQGTCFRTDGPNVFWNYSGEIPAGPWEGSIAIIGPPLEGETFDEIQNWKYWIPWSEALDRLIQLCEENRFNVIYPQDICLGTTLWSGDKLLAGRAITIFEE